VPVAKHNYGENLVDIKTFFQEFEKQLTNSVALEVELAKEHMTNELNKTKLELVHVSKTISDDLRASLTSI